jgi:hypothetical protein
MSEINNHYGSDYLHGTQKPTSISSKNQLHTFETSTTHQAQIDQNRNLNQWQNSKYGNENYRWQKTQFNSQPKPTRIEPINPNLYDSNRERETSRLSNLSKTDLIQFDNKQIKPKIIQKTSTNHLSSQSPTSWSIISEHQQQQQEINGKTKTIFQSELSVSPSSNDELIEDNVSTTSRTYRVITNDQEEQQSMDGRYVLPSNKYV